MNSTFSGSFDNEIKITFPTSQLIDQGNNIFEENN
jgi:hypothetical protein